MRIEPSTFRGYDIRGIVPDQLDAAAAEQVARAAGAFTKAKKFIVGCDVRLTSAEFKAAVINGLTKTGIDVLDIGQVSTDQFYFACIKYKLPGIQVTASHQPAEYNGFKIVQDFPMPLLATDLKPWVLEKTFPDSAKPGSVETVDIMQPFVKRMLELTDTSTIKPLKVVIDASNGMQGLVWKELVKHLPITAIPLFWEPDGTFPCHPTDVIQPEAREPLCAKVRETGANLGLIFDPDGDRCLAVDDKGNDVPGDFLTALMAETILRKHPGATIIYDIRASDAVPETVERAGGQPFVWKVGHGFIKPKMQELKAAFGGEVSGHFYFKDFDYGDCGVLSGLTMIEYVSALNVPFSQKNEALASQYHISDEINSTVKDVDAVLNKVKETYSDGEINELDGVAVRYPDWHFVVRLSSNDPLIRLTLEADSKEKMEAKRDELLKLIRE